VAAVWISGVVSRSAVLDSSGSSWWGSRDAPQRGVETAVQRRGCGRESGGTNPGRRRGPFADGCCFAMAGWGLPAGARLARERAGGGVAATGTTGLDLLQTTVELRSVHVGRWPSIWRRIGGGQLVPWVKPLGRSGAAAAETASGES
jgi:hypothetical protein